VEADPELTTIDVLVTAHHLVPFFGEFKELLTRAAFQIHLAPTDHRLAEDELVSLVHGMNAIVCGDDPITVPVIDAAPTLQVICKWGTGLDSIDVAAARQRGIAVLNTPGAFTRPVTETTLAYILYFARSLGVNDKAVRRGDWIAGPSRALEECVLGVIGVGHIGESVLRRAISLGIDCLAYDTDLTKKNVCDDIGVEFCDFETLLRRSDFVTLHCPLTPSSRHIIDRASLARMKASSVIVNTSRGALIDQNALIDALHAGQIAGAALDVFEVEPLSQGNPLMNMENVLLSPHAANHSPAYHKMISKRTIEMLLEAFGRGGLSAGVADANN